MFHERWCARWRCVLSILGPFDQVPEAGRDVDVLHYSDPASSDSLKIVELV